MQIRVHMQIDAREPISFRYGLKGNSLSRHYGISFFTIKSP